MSTGMILTTAGRNLLAKALTGKILTFTKAMCGNGKLGSKNPLTLANLISPKRELPIQSMRTSATGTAEVVVEMTNKNLSTGFFVYEYGLFAKDPDTNKEVLYSYSYSENGGYLEGDNGIDLIAYTLSLVTVIDQAPNITAVIENSNNYVTVTRMESRIQDIFGDNQPIKGFWTYAKNDTQKLRPAELGQVRDALIGTYDINALDARLKRIEDALAQTLLELEVKDIYPGYTHFIIEDFKNPDQIDMYECKVTSVIAGDDSIDCVPLEGMLPGSWYTLSDGVRSESVRVESINLENGIQRVILFDNVRNTYNLETVRLYRTSASISEDSAGGPVILKTHKWTPSLKWSGQGDSTDYTINIDTSANNAGSYSLSGKITLDTNGRITLGE